MNRRILLAPFTGLFGLLALSGTAVSETYETAADVTNDSVFATYLAGQAQMQYRAILALQEDNKAGILCEGEQTISPSALRILSPVTISEDDERPTAGRWIERYDVTVCDRTRTYNAIFSVEPDGNMNARPATPGTSSRNFDLLRDLRPFMEQSAQLGDCESRAVYDTKTGLPDGYNPEVADGSYDTWTVVGCGEAVDMVLRFAPAEDGNVSVSVETQIFNPIEIN